MDIRSKHLSSEDRGVILAEHNRGSIQRLIGQLLHRPASTICRELARGRQEDGSYCPQAARQAYDDQCGRFLRHVFLIALCRGDTIKCSSNSSAG
jgi:IS30 family transposase